MQHVPLLFDDLVEFLFALSDPLKLVGQSSLVSFDDSLLLPQAVALLLESRGAFVEIPFQIAQSIPTAFAFSTPWSSLTITLPQSISLESSSFSQFI